MKATPVEALSADFARAFEAQPSVVARAPGRVNLIGEHTDYNGGLALPVPLDRGVHVAMRRRDDVIVRAVTAGVEVGFEVGERPAASAPGWATFVFGATALAQEKLGAEGGVDLCFLGDVPIGAGLSSSAALSTALLLALSGVHRLSVDARRLALLAQEVEHRFVGVRCGLLDQLASGLGRPGHALLIDCSEHETRLIPLRLDDHRIVVVMSGVERELASSAYNLRREECEAALAALREERPGLGSLGELRPEDAALWSSLPRPLHERCHHVVSENARVRDACEHLAAGRLTEMGALMNASHASLRDEYEVSHPVLDAIVEAASEVSGVLGSRMTGAGFGGCTVHLAGSAAVADLEERVRRELRPGGGVLVLDGALEAGCSDY